MKKSTYLMLFLFPIIIIMAYTKGQSEKYGVSMYSWHPKILLGTAYQENDIPIDFLEHNYKGGVDYIPRLKINGRIMESLCIGLNSICYTDKRGQITHLNHVSYYQLHHNKIIIESMSYDEKDNHGSDINVLINTYGKGNPSALAHAMEKEIAKQQKLIASMYLLTLIIVVFSYRKYYG